MVLPLIIRGGAALAARRGATEVAKQGAKRGEKFMGMVEEVGPKRLADETMRVGSRGVLPPSSSRMGTKAALAAGAAGAAGLASMGDEEETTPKRVTAAPRSEEAPSRRDEAKASAAASEAPPKTAKGGGLSPFGKAFREARSSGLSSFEFNGKRYNTMLSGESKEEHKEKIAAIKAKNEAAYEKKMEELAMRKGGMVMKKPAMAKMPMKAVKKPTMKSPTMKRK